jgi:23S rRNA (uracil1939-C5)-methyltransferase
LSRTNTPTPKAAEVFELTIDSLSYSGGRGVGRHQGLVVFVPDTAPGDQVRVRVRTRKPRFVEAEVVERLRDSPHRRVPPCPVAGRCGGCSWQHVVYAEQVVQKEKILRDSLRRLPPAEWRPFLSAPAEFHYRNRVQLHIQGGRWGFYAKGSRELVAVSQCWIAEERINAGLRDLPAAAPAGASRLELALTEDGDLILTAGARDPHAALFAQVNSAQNERLKKVVTESIAVAEPDWLMDLYCGAGNLTWPLVERYPNKTLTAVELSRASVARAREKAALARLSVDWRVGDVAAVLAELSPRSGQGVVVLDPPRTGCERDVIEQLLRHEPGQILYVSCNPATFARDAERLVASGRYTLQAVQGLDMFPQTEHVELIASLCAAP